MRFVRTHVGVALCLVLAFSISAQQGTTTTAGATQRDSQALAILAQTVASTGGATALAAVQDFTASGSITFNWAGEPVQGSVAIQGKGVYQFRMDAALPNGTRSFIVNGYAGATTSPGGSITLLPTWNALTSGSLTFPAARIMSALSDSSTAITYLGIVTWYGTQVYQVHIAPPVDPTLNPNGFPNVGSFDLYVDPASYKVQGLSETVWWIGNFAQAYQHELAFSNYTLTNGLLVPFSVTEKLGGQQTWTLQLGAINFNTGLTDAAFRL